MGIPGHYQYTTGKSIDAENHKRKFFQGWKNISLRYFERRRSAGTHLRVDMGSDAVHHTATRR